jgi:hypothetical protein
MDPVDMPAQEQVERSAVAPPGSLHQGEILGWGLHRSVISLIRTR